ncbi:hypothetical protein [Helicobacter salomonis]|uniref:hypothetical protein n=1 Tax=Helicobacter salomonis TaxID=56878 RepID=UPI000CF1B077|nr:hypothetical protein [Helicobacter salomonis]
MARLFDLPEISMEGEQSTPQSITIDKETALRHISGDSEAKDFGYDSWIAYYRENMRIQCCQLGCPHDADRGAHVKIEEYVEKWWIVPVCPKHNPPTNEPFNVKAHTIAVRHPKK